MGGCCLFVQGVKLSNNKKKTDEGVTTPWPLMAAILLSKLKSPIFGGSSRWNDRGCMGGAGRVGGVLYHCFEAGTPSNKKQQKHNTFWP